MVERVVVEIQRLSQLEKRQLVLLLAAIDMEQTIEAARAIEREAEREARVTEEPNVQLVRALETAIAVCYWRPFTSSSIGQLDPAGDGPPVESGLGDLHRALKTMRDKVYAHTDVASGRSAGVSEHVTESGTEGLAFSEGWWAFPREWLPRVILLAEQQRDRFRTEAVEIQRSTGVVRAWESPSA
jgi:hypothetical protein